MRKLLVLLALSLPLVAQQPSQPQDDPIGQNLVPPDLIMAHQDEIGLQEKQREAIKNEVLKTQPKFLEWQWQLGEETQKMLALLRATPADEAKVLEQADRIMALEREIKRAHLGMLVRLRNQLTPEQFARLQQLRRH
jgi:Spy/CpxP family protein refolding chaperone